MKHDGFYMYMYALLCTRVLDWIDDDDVRGVIITLKNEIRK